MLGTHRTLFKPSASRNLYHCKACYDDQVQYREVLEGTHRSRERHCKAMLEFCKLRINYIILRSLFVVANKGFEIENNSNNNLPEICSLGEDSPMNDEHFADEEDSRNTGCFKFEGSLLEDGMISREFEFESLIW